MSKFPNIDNIMMEKLLRESKVEHTFNNNINLIVISYMQYFNNIAIMLVT